MEDSSMNEFRTSVVGGDFGQAREIIRERLAVFGGVQKHRKSNGGMSCGD
jgi:hypothetical protein